MNWGGEGEVIVLFGAITVVKSALTFVFWGKGRSLGCEMYGSIGGMSEGGWLIRFKRVTLV